MTRGALAQQKAHGRNQLKLKLVVGRFTGWLAGRLLLSALASLNQPIKFEAGNRLAQVRSTLRPLPPARRAARVQLACSAPAPDTTTAPPPPVRLSATFRFLLGQPAHSSSGHQASKIPRSNQISTSRTRSSFADKVSRHCNRCAKGASNSSSPLLARSALDAARASQLQVARIGSLSALLGRQVVVAP